MIINASTHFGALATICSITEKLMSTREAIPMSNNVSIWIVWSMAHARKRLPIDASAKCSGTRSGVSIIKTSSFANVADIIFAAD